MVGDVLRYYNGGEEVGVGRSLAIDRKLQNFIDGMKLKEDR